MASDDESEELMHLEAGKTAQVGFATNKAKSEKSANSFWFKSIVGLLVVLLCINMAILANGYGKNTNVNELDKSVEKMEIKKEIVNKEEVKKEEVNKKEIPVVAQKECPKCEHVPLIEKSANVENCQWKFNRYESSPWEKLWDGTFDQWRNRPCELLLERDLSKMDQHLIRGLELLYSSDPYQQASAVEESLYSKMHYTLECTNGTSVSPWKYAWQYIEPLVFVLRDPFFICPAYKESAAVAALSAKDRDLGHDASTIQSKVLFLHAITAPFIKLSSSSVAVNVTKDCLSEKLFVDSGSPSKTACVSSRSPFISTMAVFPNTAVTPAILDVYKGRTIIFDLGSSYFTGWNGATMSASRFLVNLYKKKGIPVSDVFMFEYTVLDRKIFWDNVPEELMGKIHLINVGVEADAASKYNPWNLLKRFCRPDDYVHIKLDIDTPGIEVPLFEQILNDSELSSLVDEISFEHHVQTPPMDPHWGSAGFSQKIDDSYRYYRLLRAKGIRSHSWP